MCLFLSAPVRSASVCGVSVVLANLVVSVLVRLCQFLSVVRPSVPVRSVSVSVRQVIEVLGDCADGGSAVEGGWGYVVLADLR